MSNIETRDRIIALYNRTKNNCLYYEKKGEEMGLLNEIGCLRGIAYCLEEVGVSPLADAEFRRLIEIQQKFKEADNK